MTPKTIKKVKEFLNASNDNREFEAYLAYREKAPWPYSIPLESVVSYLKFHKESSID